MVNLTKTTILQNSWKTIYQLISDNVSDPESRSGNPRWITNSFPDLKGSKFPNYPIIIIGNPKPDESNSTLGRKKRDVTLRFSIWLYTKKNQYLDTVGDDLRDAITANQATTEAAGIFSPKISASNIVTTVVGKDKIHFRNFEVMYNYYSDV